MIINNNIVTIIFLMRIDYVCDELSLLVLRLGGSGKVL